MNSRKKMAKLRVRLKGFVKPSTRSQVEGYLEPGDYVVEDIKLNQPPDLSRLRFGSSTGAGCR